MLKYLKSFFLEEDGDEKVQNELEEQKEDLEEAEELVPERELFGAQKTFRFPIIDDNVEDFSDTDEYRNTADYRFKSSAEISLEKEEAKMEEEKSKFIPKPVFSLTKGFLDPNYKLPKSTRGLKEKEIELEDPTEDLQKARSRIYRGDVEEVYRAQEEQTPSTLIFKRKDFTIKFADEMFKEKNMEYDHNNDLLKDEKDIDDTLEVKFDNTDEHKLFDTDEHKLVVTEEHTLFNYDEEKTHEKENNDNDDEINNISQNEDNIYQEELFKENDYEEKEKNLLDIIDEMYKN